MDECSAFRGISQSTAFCGTTPGLGLRLILLLLLLRVTARPCDMRVEEAGGGGRSEVGLLGPDRANTSSSGTVSSVGKPLYGEEGVGECADLPDRTDPARELVLLFQCRVSLGPSSTSTLPSLQVLPPPLPKSLDCCVRSFDKPFDRVRGASEKSAISTGTFSFDSLFREIEGVRALARGEEDVGENGGGEMDAERAALEVRGETDVKRDKGSEGETGSV